MILLIDCHALCYRSYYSTGHLSWGDRATGIPYGFFRQLLKMGLRFHTNDFVFCWDSNASKRKRFFKEYKANRDLKKKTEQEQKERSLIHAQMDALRDAILPASGDWDSFRIKGLEADDLIASFPVHHRAYFRAVSGDNDLFQLLKYPNFDIYSPGTNKPGSDRIITSRSFFEEYGLPARCWLAVKCIAGCPGDGVPGVPGVGYKTAISYLKGELKSGCSKERAIESPEGQRIIRRNLPLVQLPIKGTPKLKLKGYRPELKRLLWTFGDLGFSSFLEGELKEEWKYLVEIHEHLPF